MTTRRCAFLTMDDTSGWSIDADLAIAPLTARGWTVETLPWRTPGHDWRDFDAVYIGTPWDYPDDPERFLAVLAAIEDAGTVLVNPLSLVRWSLEKTYLRDLEARGAAIVPSLWFDALSEDMIDGLFAECGERLIIKPVVSTNAHDTFLLDTDVDAATREMLERTFAARPFMVQPFMEAIVTEGEYSLFYLGGAYSHAIRKTPKARDFRVQEEHGARIRPVAADESLVAVADRVLSLVTPAPVYARCDLVRGADGRWLLMELEVIEPSLYLRMDAAAPERFAAAFDRHVAKARSER